MAPPPPIKGFTPRGVQSPSAIRAHADCPRMWGHVCLEGRRVPQPLYHELPPKPAKAPKGASAVEQARAKAALKAYNAAMRPAQGTALHYIWELYYRHKVPGAWHPPLAHRASELDELWHTRPGQIALSGREHLPAPSSLAEVWIEELVSLDLSFLPGGWPTVTGHDPRTGEEVVGRLLIGGTPDLVTCWHVEAEADDEAWTVLVKRFHLYDYKSTVSIDEYAKTAEELLEDEQAAIYSLAVMQAHGLDQLDCTWLYFQTDENKSARAMPVRFTMTRAHAEAIVKRIAQHALGMAEVQARFLAERPGMLGRRLEVIQSLDTNDMSCDNFSGCVFHVKRGGFCKPRKSTLAEAMRKQSTKDKKTQRRREASQADKQQRKEEKAGVNMAATKEQMARIAELEAMGASRKFKDNQELKKLKTLAEAEGGEEASEPKDVETTGEEAPKEEAPKEEKPATPSKPKPASKGISMPSEGIAAAVDGFLFNVPAGSQLGKQLAKAAKALQVAASAFEGE